jgi:hypothetical protein
MESFDDSFVTWLRPAGVIDSGEVVTARKAVATQLSEGGPDWSELVLAAHGKLHPALQEQIEQRLRDADPTHTNGRKHLVELVAAAGLMRTMEMGANGSVLIALMILSARFASYKPMIKSMVDRAELVISQASGRSRTRLPMKRVTSRTNDADTDQQVRALAGRLEQAIGHFDTQLQLLNEEIDILWWSRSGLNSSGEAWTEMAPVKRAVSATAEVAEFIVDYPITGAVFEILRGVVEAPAKKTATVLDVAEEVSDSSIPRIDGSAPLLPLLSAGRIVRDYPTESRAGIIEAEVWVAADRKIKIDEIPAQLLREIAIAESYK